MKGAHLCPQIVVFQSRWIANRPMTVLAVAAGSPAPPFALSLI